MALLIFKPLNTNQWSFLHGVSNRARRALENRTMIDDDRIALMEDQLKQAKYIAEEREQMYEEVCYTVRPNTNPPKRKVKARIPAHLTGLFRFGKGDTVNGGYFCTVLHPMRPTSAPRYSGLQVMKLALTVACACVVMRAVIFHSTEGEGR